MHSIWKPDNEKIGNPAKACVQFVHVMLYPFALSVI